MVTDTFNISESVCHKLQQDNQITNIQSMTYSNKLKYKESLLYKKKQTSLFLFLIKCLFLAQEKFLKIIVF